MLTPHVPLDFAVYELLGVFGYAVVGQMGESVPEILVTVFLGAKAKVALVKKPDFRLIAELTDQNPLPNVEFSVPYQKRVLNVFLNHILGLLPHNAVENFVHSSNTPYASASGENWLAN